MPRGAMVVYKCGQPSMTSRESEDRHTILMEDIYICLSLKKAEGDRSIGKNVTKDISGDLNYICNGTEI